MKKIASAFVLALTSWVAACGSDTSTPSTSSSSGGSSGTSGTSGTSGAPEDAATPKVNSVTVKSNEFVPKSLTVKVGDTVTWTWAGGVHDVVSGPGCKSDGAWKSTLQSTAGATFTHTFDAAGSFEYFCTPHCQNSAMIGTIVVQ